ncbi:MAG: cell division protein FtsQ/DivIB [Roseimicrobium sp.]
MSLLLDKLLARNTRRKTNAVRGNYVFRARRKKVRLNVHRIELNPETDASRRAGRKRALRYGARLAAMVLLVTLFTSAVAIVVRDAFVENDRFILKHFSVTTEGELSEADIIAACGVRKGVNLLGVSLVEVRDRLQALPQVRSAKVSRGYPGLLFMNVEQQRPVAWLECPEQRLKAKVPGAGCLIDEQGAVLPAGEVTYALERLPCICVKKLGGLVPGAPVKDSPEIRAALDLLLAHDASSLRAVAPIKSVDASRGYVMEVTFESSLQVKFPDRDFAAQMRRLQGLLDEAAKQQWAIASVNLLVEKHVPITLRPTLMTAEQSDAAPMQRQGLPGSVATAN